MTALAMARAFRLLNWLEGKLSVVGSFVQKMLNSSASLPRVTNISLESTPYMKFEKRFKGSFGSA